jgi:hypothetical protein
MIALARGTMITTTTFGSWLPGDVRGYVERGQTLPPAPRLESFAKSQMKVEAVVLDVLNNPSRSKRSLRRLGSLTTT